MVINIIADIDDTLTTGGNPETAKIDKNICIMLEKMLKKDSACLTLCTGRNGSLQDILNRSVDSENSPLLSCKAVYAGGQKYRDEKGKTHDYPLSSETKKYKDEVINPEIEKLITTLSSIPKIKKYLFVSRNSEQKANKGLLLATREHVINFNYSKFPENTDNGTLKMALKIINKSFNSIGNSGFSVCTNPAKKFVEIVCSEIDKSSALEAHKLYKEKALNIFIADDLKGRDRASAIWMKKHGGEIWQTAYGSDKSNVIKDTKDEACPDRIFYTPKDLAKALLTCHQKQKVYDKTIINHQLFHNER